MAGFVDEFEAGGKQPSLRARCVLVDAEPKVVRRAQAGSTPGARMLQVLPPSPRAIGCCPVTTPTNNPSPLVSHAPSLGQPGTFPLRKIGPGQGGYDSRTRGYIDPSPLAIGSCCRYAPRLRRIGYCSCMCQPLTMIRGLGTFSGP